jgi:16S rRNA (cytosine967-C5)-methyltransferase
MRLHIGLLAAIVDTVHTIFVENKKADKAIQAVLKSNKRWGARDRAFIAKYSYEMVRWWRLLHFINETSIDNARPFIIWKLLGILLRLQDIELPELEEFKGITRNKVNARFKEAQSIRKVRESLPDWIDKTGEIELKDKWEEMCKALNHQAPLSIRINTLKTDFRDLSARLENYNIELLRVNDVKDAAYVKERVNLFNLEEFKNGLFEIQDAGSQLIAEYLEVKPGMRVIDACAGAGGKSLHLACIMENKGSIISLDVEEWKLDELRKRAKRNGVHNIDARPIIAKTIKRLRESADAVLLDVPCSGLGVLRRNPDAKWKIKEEWLNEVRKTQAEILENYSKMAKIGGKVVYATCSILPSENEDQVNNFLINNPNFELIKQHHTNPAIDKFDGFYMALMQRKS